MSRPKKSSRIKKNQNCKISWKEDNSKNVKKRKLNDLEVKELNENIVSEDDSMNPEVERQLEEVHCTYEEENENLEETEEEVKEDSNDDIFRKRYILEPFDENLFSNSEKKKYQEYQESNDVTSILAVFCKKNTVSNIELSYSGVKPNLSLPKDFDYHIKSRLLSKWNEVYDGKYDKVNGVSLSDFQRQIFPLLNSYLDVHFSMDCDENTPDISSLVALHTLNHVLKTRDTIIKNSEKVKQQASSKTQNSTVEVEKEYRDQGFTRPTVLILVPFRSSAQSFVESLLKILPEGVKTVFNRDRFQEEFGPEEEEDEMPDVLRKPVDWQKIFQGNHDDCFQIGISFTRKAMRLYTEYYNSDIIIASPLALRMRIGAEGERNQEYDFLSSIEIVSLLQSDVFEMQNWNHVIDIFKVLNQTPRQGRSSDFSRVKEYHLAGHSSCMRQTLLFGSHSSASFNALFNRYCKNIDGCVRILGRYLGDLSDVVPSVKQVFQRMNCSSLACSSDERLAYFDANILQKMLQQDQTHTLIFIPSYFDFVRVRNLLKKEEANFSSCSEYASGSEITRSRTYFQQGQSNIMIYSGRLHFFRRHRIRGIRHIIFYGVPQYSRFYSEMLNLLEEDNLEPISSICLYSKYDAFELERIVGTKRARKLLQGEKSTFLFC